jgi:hypothetical protein
MHIANQEDSKQVFLAGFRAIVEKMALKAPILNFGKMAERIRDFFKRFLKKNQTRRTFVSMIYSLQVKRMLNAMLYQNKNENRLRINELYSRVGEDHFREAVGQKYFEMRHLDFQIKQLLLKALKDKSLKPQIDPKVA